MILDRRHALAGLAAVVLAGGGGAAYKLAKGRPTASPVNTLDSADGAAIKGYDPVAYFVSGKPVRGRPEHSATYNSATWLFASAGNKALFEKDPAKFAPAFGGYCAYGVAHGYLVKIEPDAWSIRDGKLYLNYDVSVQRDWEKGAPRYISLAASNWPLLVQKN